MAESWNVARSGLACAQCGSEFREGRTYFSALTEQGADFVRRDFCPPCWQQAKGGSFFSFWETRRLPAQRRPRIDTEVVLDFLRKLQEDEQPERKQMRFVLALYLVRRRVLKLAGVRREGDRHLLEFRRPRRQETLTVEDPHLSEEQIGTLTARLKELFQEEP